MVHRTTLLDRLNLAKPCLSNQDYIPILTHFCFYDGFIVAFDGRNALIVEDDSGLNCGIPGDLFLKLLNSYQDKEVQIKEKGGKLVIGKGLNKAILNTMSAEEFVFENPDLEDALELEINESFILGLKSCLSSVGEDMVGAQSSLTLDINQDEKEPGIELYSTDGGSISYFYVNMDPPSFEKKLLLPKLLCEQMVSLSEKLKELPIIYFGANFVQVNFDKVFIYSKLENDPVFLPYKEVIEMFLPEDKEFISVPKEVFPILDRSIILNSIEDTKKVEIEIKDSEVKFSTNSSGRGKAEETSTFKGLEGELTLEMDPVLFKRCLNLVEKGTFTSVEGNSCFVGRKENYVHMVRDLSA